MLNEAWERFRELQYSCPHHGIPDWLLIQSFYAGLTDSSRTSVDAVAGGALLDRETTDAINFVDSIATNQQWPGRESTRATGSGRFEVDQITALTAKLDSMQKAFDKITVKALGDQQPKSCVMCGDEGHLYEHCPLAQRDDEPENVNSLNNEPSYFLKPPYNQSYSKDQAEQQAWRWKNGNPAPFSNNANRNFYNNAAFNNSNNHAPYQGPSKPYVAPVVTDFMHEQGKMNQIIFEQMQQINAQLAGLATQNIRTESQNASRSAPNQLPPGMLPSQPEVNPRGEVKAVTLRSGTQYEGPSMPVEPEIENTVRTDPIRPIQVESPMIPEQPEPVQTEVVTEKIDHTVCTESVRPVQREADKQKKKVTVKPPPYRPPVPFPQRLAETRLNE